MATDFDEKAATWDDDPAKVERARDVAETIRETVPLTPTTRLLDYGAGTGLLSQMLADEVGAITLAEPSAGMRAVAARKLANGALPADTRIWDLDLACVEPPDERFDLIATSMTLHHIHDVDRVLVSFERLLDDAGRLAIVDLDAEDGSFHDDDFGFDGHHGFDRDTLRQQLEQAGFVDVEFRNVHDVDKDGRAYPLFLAVAAVRRTLQPQQRR